MGGLWVRLCAHCKNLLNNISAIGCSLISSRTLALIGRTWIVEKSISAIPIPWSGAPTSSQHDVLSFFQMVDLQLIVHVSSFLSVFSSPMLNNSNASLHLIWSPSWSTACHSFCWCTSLISIPLKLACPEL